MVGRCTRRRGAPGRLREQQLHIQQLDADHDVPGHDGHSAAHHDIPNTTTSPTTPATTKSTTSASPPSIPTSIPTTAAGVAQAVAACKSISQRDPTLSSSLKAKVEGICNKAAHGNLAGARAAAKAVCAEVINASPIPAVAKSEALAACQRG